MKPLYAVALGLVMLAIGPVDQPPGTFDPVPDPLGWVFILVGMTGLKPALDPQRYPTLRAIGIVAFGVSIAMVVPAVERWLATEPSLGWSADVPRFGFFLLLCHLLSRSALAARHTFGASSFSICGMALVFVLIAPPLAFGAGWGSVGQAGELTAQVVQLALVVLMLAFAGRRWAGHRPEQVESPPADTPGA